MGKVNGEFLYTLATNVSDSIRRDCSMKEQCSPVVEVSKVGSFGDANQRALAVVVRCFSTSCPYNESPEDMESRTDEAIASTARAFDVEGEIYDPSSN